MDINIKKAEQIKLKYCEVEILFFLNSCKTYRTYLYIFKNLYNTYLKLLN